MPKHKAKKVAKKAPMVKRPYTPEEDSMILRGISPSKIAKELNRPLSSVSSRKNYLKYNPQASAYTPPEGIIKSEVKMAAKTAGSTMHQKVEELLREADAEEELMAKYMGISVNGRIIFVERDAVDMISVEDDALQIQFKD